MKRFLPIVLTFAGLLAGFSATAQEQESVDSMKVSFYYVVAKHDIDNNFIRHQKMVRELADTCRVDSAIVHGFVSPEGGKEFNRVLAINRAEALAGLIRNQWPDVKILEAKGCGVDYSIEQKKENWPLMRRADAYIWYHPLKREKPAPAAPVIVNVCPCTGAPVCNCTGTACGCSGDGCCKCAEKGTGQKDTVVIYYTPQEKTRILASQDPAWALKTNMLLLGVAAPNLQAEFPLGTKNRWSVEGEVICPWWTFAHNAYAEQVLNFGVEFRYWLGSRQYHPVLDGWHIGLAAAFGYYDLEWKSKGIQGEHVNGYLNIGYQHRFGKDDRWGIDAGVGIGALYTPRHRRYLGSTLFPENHLEEYDDHLMYQNKGLLLWPGASHVNVTIMYFFDMKKKEESR
ncbi:MAG: DUF3575 domain-containing protein [Bacteroidales bacterium]|nr:DUF3575 domain-containing protein [Bacteroidales bacterium]